MFKDNPNHQFDMFQVKDNRMTVKVSFVGEDDDYNMLDAYQDWVDSVAIYPSHFGIMYTVTGLAAEAGEAAGKIGKVYRDKNGEFDRGDIEAIEKELGDVLWMIAGVCNEFDIHLSDVMKKNVEKIEDRKNRGVLGGSGDNR